MYQVPFLACTFASHRPQFHASPLQVVFCLLHAPVLFADLSPQPSGPILSLACVSMHLGFSALLFLQSQAIVERLFLPLVC